MQISMSSPISKFHIPSSLSSIQAQFSNSTSSHSSEIEPFCPKSFQEYREGVFQRFSPLFFNAIVHWSQFKCSEVIVNRIQVLEHLDLLLKFLRRPENLSKVYQFQLQFSPVAVDETCDNFQESSGKSRQEQTKDLLLNVYDYYSQHQLTPEDNHIIEKISDSSINALFYNYFSELFLQPLTILWKSGVMNGERLLIPLKTLQSLLDLFAKAFLFSESSGILSIQFHEDFDTMSEIRNVGQITTLRAKVRHLVKLTPLSSEGKKLLHLVLSLRNPSFDSAAQPAAPFTSLPFKKRSFKELSAKPYKVSNSSISAEPSSFREEESLSPCTKSALCYVGNTKSDANSSRQHNKSLYFLRNNSLLDDEEYFEPTVWTDHHPSVNNRIARFDESKAEEILFSLYNIGPQEFNRKCTSRKAYSSNSKTAASSAGGNDDVVRLKKGIIIGEVINCSPSYKSSSVNKAEEEEVDCDEISGKYRIQWENDEVEVIRDSDYRNGLKFYDSYFGWKTDGHESIGKKVAKYFYLTSKRADKEESKRVYFGVVTKYAPPEDKTDSPKTENGMNVAADQAVSHDGELFHILWEDGDQEDLDFYEFQQGRHLFQSLKETPSKKPSMQRRVKMMKVDEAAPLTERGSKLRKMQNHCKSSTETILQSASLSIAAFNIEDFLLHDKELNPSC